MGAGHDHHHRHFHFLHLGGGSGTFEGWRSRVYNVLARWPMRGVYRRIAQDLAAMAPERGAVLDVGTGPGVLLLELAQRRADLTLTGVDLSADMVALAQRNLAKVADRASARVADVAALPFADESFDLVVSSFSLHHWEDPEAAVAELARVLRPGGALVIYDFDRAPFDRLEQGARERSLFTGAPSQRTPFRVGLLTPGRCVRFVMTTAAAGSARQR
ncbi:class I SAM-dependent methyltransferase [Thermasporomyces composti]|jgi:ubiquinone/menaquinone biosynthesis C-methylase UbiE|uniref:Methyltransferase family protein n=1 Tax=Thermasporomyces composti TaxID=696763 RepID=A0A3D9VBI5_THECX|nr:class I SAM-dependent methyltransferase [Thermasporomyces composti]REF35524.1 methyltransferase family protein [Thermasporomyces composti]